MIHKRFVVHRGFERYSIRYNVGAAALYVVFFFALFQVKLRVHCSAVT